MSKPAQSHTLTTEITPSSNLCESDQERNRLVSALDTPDILGPRQQMLARPQIRPAHNCWLSSALEAKLRFLCGTAYHLSVCFLVVKKKSSPPRFQGPRLSLAHLMSEPRLANSALYICCCSAFSTCKVRNVDPSAVLVEFCICLNFSVSTY